MSDTPQHDIPTVSMGAGSRSPDHPQQLGPYHILEMLGEGGMGVVYLAEQKTPVRRRVALKLVKLGMDTKEVVARFESERQALALMTHPNVAAVYDAGATEQGRPYFVMEYVPGVPLTEYCDKHKLTTRERLELFIPVCQAIQHAHQKGIIHRDIKPSNVLVTVQDSRPVPKVIDFGIAKATNQRLTERTVFTEQGRLIGTPEYMSPEQAEMSPLDIDTRTDVYSLGVLLYELLVGALPFDPQSLRRAGYAEIQRIIREVEPSRPSTRLSSLQSEPKAVAAGLSQRRVPAQNPRLQPGTPPVSADAPTAPSGPLPTAPDLPKVSVTEPRSAMYVAEHRHTDPKALVKQLRGDLDWITMKAMDKDRTRRYASASEFAADIAHYLNFEPVKAGPPTVGYRLKKFVRKYRGPVAAAAAFVLLLAAALVATSALYVETKRAKDAESAQRARADQKAAEAETQRQLAVTNEEHATSEAANAKREAAKATKVQEFLQSMLASIDPQNAKGANITVREVVDAAAQRVEQEFPDEPDIRAAVLTTIGQTYLGLGLAERAQPPLQTALDIRRATYGENSLESATSLMALARIGMAWTGTSDDRSRALARCREALAIRTERLGAGHELTKESRFLETQLMWITGDLQGGVRTYAKWALPLLFAQFTPEEFSGETAAAIRQVQELWEAGDEDGAVAVAWRYRVDFTSNVGTLWGAGNHDAARDLVRQLCAPLLARPLYREQLAGWLGDFSVWLASQHETLDAQEPFLREAVAVARDVHGEQSTQYARALGQLGGLLASRRDYAAAESTLREACDIGGRFVGTQHPEFLHALKTLATCLTAQGKDEEAASVLQEGWEAAAKAGGGDSQPAQDLLADLIALYEKANKPEQVSKWRARLPPRLGLHHPTVDGLVVKVNGFYQGGELRWDWGDGTTSVDHFVATHKYARPGTFTITATVSNERGRFATKTVVVTVVETMAPTQSGADETQPASAPVDNPP